MRKRCACACCNSGSSTTVSSQFPKLRSSHSCPRGRWTSIVLSLFRLAVIRNFASHWPLGSVPSADSNPACCPRLKHQPFEYFTHSSISIQHLLVLCSAV